MKITIEHYDKTHSSEIPDDSDIYEVARILHNLLILDGYHPDTVKDIIDLEQ